MLLNDSIYKLIFNGCISTNSRYFRARLRNVGPSSKKNYAAYTLGQNERPNVNDRVVLNFVNYLKEKMHPGLARKTVYSYSSAY